MKVRILNRCRVCNYRNPSNKRNCLCGVSLREKDFYLDYYLEGKRIRSHIGSSMKAAQYEARRIQQLEAENKYIPKDPFGHKTLNELIEWYVNLPVVIANKSNGRIHNALRNINEAIQVCCRDITVQHLEEYSLVRKASPATIKLELTALKAVYRKAVEYKKLSHNPIKSFKIPVVENKRDRVLTDNEFEALIGECDEEFRKIVIVAYYTGMRKREILDLRWHEVDLNEQVITLDASRTKSKKSRKIPIHHPRLKEVFDHTFPALYTDYVFLTRGKRYGDPKSRFISACKRAGIVDFHFHDLRHCAINNFRLSGLDIVTINTIVGHTSMDMHVKYCTVTDLELNNIKWLDQVGEMGLEVKKIA